MQLFVADDDNVAEGVDTTLVVLDVDVDVVAGADEGFFSSSMNALSFAVAADETFLFNALDQPRIFPTPPNACEDHL